MATTTSGFRYPVSADDPDIPRDIRQLAEDIDNYLNATGSGAFNGVLPVIDINGNSSTATKLATSRTISLGGSLSGTASFDGSANITISATVDPVAGTMPVGAMTQYLGTTAPTGWLLCDGANVSRSTYGGLFTVLGTRYGAGDGATTFALPDLRSRFARGSASTASLSGTAGGSATHQHTNTGLSTGSAGGHNHEVDVPSFDITGGSHGHTITDHTHTGPSHTHPLTAHDHAGPSHTHPLTAHDHTGPSHTHTMAHDHTFNPVTTTSDSDSHSHTDTTGTPSYSGTAAFGSTSVIPGVQHTHSVSTSSDSHNHDTNIGEGDTGASSAANTGSSGTAVTGSGAFDGASPAGGSDNTPFDITEASGTGSTGNGLFDGASPAGGLDNTAFDITEAGGTGNTGLGGNDANTNTSHTHTVNPAAFNTSGGEGAHTHGQGTSDSVSNIPPYIDVNYIVKI
jgi:hypothetical protein